MKIKIGKINPSVGPGIFVTRLMKTLVQEFGIKLVDSHPDIFLGIISLDGAPRGAKRVLRIDGLYWDKARFYKNSKIFRDIRKSDGVIFQSEFSKNCYNRYVSHVNSAVVLNGIDIKWARSIEPSNIEPGIVATAKWRPIKRYKSICSGYAYSGVSMPLHMVGEKPPDAPQHPGIIWHGKKTSEQTIAIVKKCKYAIHLGQFDSCPNSVVEESALGLPVLCPAIGGAAEIVKEYGLKIPVDFDSDFGTLQGVTEIDERVVGEYIQKLVGLRINIPDRKDLDIRCSARKYYDFFVRLLR